MSTETKNNATHKHIIKNMMKTICMPVHKEYCG